MVRPVPTLLFHFTRVEHLETIVATGLHCDRRAQAEGVLSIEVGNTDVKSLRGRRSVPVHPGGVVADYVPFYYATRSPMLYVIERGGVPSYIEGTDRIIYLGTTLERVAELGLDPVLTDRNAALRVAAFHRWADGEPEDSFIDWPLMKATMWNSDAEHPDRMERRMAECLVYDTVPWTAIQFVGAKSQTVLDEVNSVLAGTASPPSVGVRRHWYF
ncbi:hypothetical protein GCM10011376_06020 [Nocardioides flavus (ex Wang et al. 2016)]|uniref:DarT domain-containing protein n=1 Tax=Nocardioides flavus (ex Wang et al. 2016) TaxID=2058780 RepID=A0ABQ3HHR3_9ACTN|nr:DUF4433 domain-containing protein [Nocardioides flavus (ex Wang et al. 2016)]GHE15853.1 hypothetical protein GCM10011376_06020 [Nocardioides flavus (ex Wang et al. 2016)]